MPEGKAQERAVIVVITFDELERALGLPPGMQISHVQKRALVQELFLRLEAANCPEVSSEKGHSIARGELILDEEGQFEELKFFKE